MATEAALAMIEPRGTSTDRLVHPASAFPRDKSFKLADIGLLQLLPIARSLRPKLFFISVGFVGDVENILHAIYHKNEVAGHGVASIEAGPDAEAVFLKQLDTLSGLESDSRFDCLSLLGCELSLVVLNMVCAGQFRPGLIHIADTDSFEMWAHVRSALLTKGYAVAGRLESAELLIDSPLFDSPKRADNLPAVTSFDVFDTLIARRCIDPWRVFAMVAERTGLTDFAEQRRAAEQRVIAKIYSFDDIYEELGRHYQLDDAAIRALKECELACELEMAIPIAENIARVKDGDLLISDMYLSEADIRGLLTKAGLSRSVGLLVSSHGKSGGLVWPKVQKTFSIIRHIGDNPHADGVMANRAGIKSEITQASALNVVETMFMETGLVDLARLSREARLATWHEDPEIRMLQIVQTSINFPMLLLSSVHLARTAERAGCRTLLFCSRDCNLWHPLFDALRQRIGFTCDTRYFMTSRLARLNGSAAYHAYTRKSLAQDGMIIDLCGTGWSTANLIAKAGIEKYQTYFIDHRAPLAVYENKAKTPDNCVIHKLFRTPHGIDNAVLECANYADHPMCLDMQDIDGTLLPIFALDSRTKRERDIITVQREAFFSAMRAMQSYALDDVIQLDDSSIETLCMALYGYLGRQSAAFNLFAPTFHAENNMIMKRLTAPDERGK